MQRFVFRARDLTAELLKRTIDMPTLDGRPVFVTLRHAQPDGSARVSHSPVDAHENYHQHFGSTEPVGRRTIQVDIPIPVRGDLPTTATRLRTVLHAPSGMQHSYGYDLTAYRPLDEGEDYVPPDRLHFREDDVRSMFLIRNHLRGDRGRAEVRSVTQHQVSASHDLDRVQTFITDAPGLELAYGNDHLPAFTNHEKQIMDLGACAFAHSQLRQDLAILSALIGEDPSTPLGIY
jgi:hypothetical protein